MEVVVAISQTLLYVCFAVLAGSFILLLVPSNNRPDVKIPKRLLLVSAAGVPVFAFMPVLDITLFIAPRLGFIESLKIVLTTYRVGTAWDFTLLVSIVLLLVIAIAKKTDKSGFALFGALLTLGLMFTIAWSSHVSTISPGVGITSHFIHLAAVSIWVGILLIVGWCSTNHENWLAFLSWFSIVAFACLFATGFSGLLLMDAMVDSYTDAWLVSYGQGLLIKHLFLLPVIFYALVNGFIVKYMLNKNAAFNPIPWVRVEGFILFVVFAFTAYFSLQSPPHGNYLTEDAVSPLFRLFHDGVITAESTIGFVVNLNTVLFFFLAVLFIGLLALAYIKKASIAVSFLFSCLFVLSIYLMLMVTVVVR